MRSADLDAPFHGVRSHGPVETVEDRARAYATKMPDTSCFSHSTAALLWGVPLGSADSAIHVSVPAGSHAPRGRGVVGHSITALPTTELQGLRLVEPNIAWAQLAGLVTTADLVAAGDFLVTGLPFDGIEPLTDLENLRSASLDRVGRRGASSRTRALEFIRVGALSRPESHLRFLLESAGLPKAVINEAVYDRHGNFLALPDLKWPDLKIAVEYEGDGHRDRSRFRRDIHRIERLVDAGWLVVKVAAPDLYARGAETVARVASRLRSRGWGGRIRHDLPHLGHP